MLNTIPMMPLHGDLPIASADIILETHGVSVRYDQHDALSDVSIEIRRGERMAVVGPNGAGKSTLFKVLVGMLRPTSGSTASHAAMGGEVGVAYVPQRSQIDWRFPVSVADVVMMGRTGKVGLFRRPGTRDRAIVHRSLEAVGMTTFASRQIGELSGGQQQRVFVARALAQEAELMLLDEPLTGLDFASQEDFFQLLSQLQQQGVTIVVSTHDLSQAAAHFDRVLLLNRTVIGLGPASEVLTVNKLHQAYGGHARIIQAGDEFIMLGDSHCDGC